MTQGLVGLSSVIAGPGLIAFVVAQMGDLLGPNRGSLLCPTLAAYASSATVYLATAAVNFVIAMTLIGPALLTDPYAAVNSPNTELYAWVTLGTLGVSWAGQIFLVPSMSALAYSLTSSPKTSTDNGGFQLQLFPGGGTE